MKSNELKVGLAVLISLVILVGGIIWGKGYRLSSSRISVSVVFHSVGGLEEGANVLANGVVKGSVKGIEFRQGSVLVNAALDKDVTVYSDYLVTIESPTVMAGNALSIYTGSELPEVDLSQPLEGNDPLGMSAMVGKVQVFADKIETTLGLLNDLIVNMNKIVGDSSNQANTADLLAEAAETARHTNQLLAENREKVTASLDKLDAILGNSEAITLTARERMDATIDGIDSAMTAITDLAVELRGFMTKLQSEEGTVGKLLYDDELYIRLTETLAEVDSLSASLRTKGLRHKIVFF